MDLQNRLARLDEIIALAPGWLDGGGKAISQANANVARDLLGSFDSVHSQFLPSVFPTEEGGISLEWVSNNFAFLEVEVEDGNMFMFSMEAKTQAKTRQYTSSDKATKDDILTKIAEWVKENPVPYVSRAHTS